MAGVFNLTNLSFKADGFKEMLTESKRFEFRVRQLLRHAVYVGAFKIVNDKSVDFMQMVCAVQNRGCTIVPVHGKYLTIPMPIAKGHRAADFGKYSKGNPNGLFFHIAASSGRPTLARNVNGSLQVVFLLYKQVVIPARGFVDTTADECMHHVNEIVKDELYHYWAGHSNYLHTLNLIGRYLADSMKSRIKLWNSPPNANITAAGKGMNDPLVDTGDLMKSISWVIV